MKKTRVMSLAIATLTLGSMSAFASHLTVTTKNLGAGKTVVAACDPNASTDWTYIYQFTGSSINGLTIGGIPGGCLTGNLSVTVTDSSGSHVSSTSSPVAISASSVAVTLGTAELPANVANVH